MQTWTFTEKCLVFNKMFGLLSANMSKHLKIFILRLVFMLMFFSRFNQYLPAFPCLLAILFLVLDIFIVTKNDRDKGINMHLSDFNVSETFMDTADSLFCYYNLKIKIVFKYTYKQITFFKNTKESQKGLQYV